MATHSGRSIGKRLQVLKLTFVIFLWYFSYAYDNKVDRYLYGHPTRRIFRSANEFGPHAVWLLKGREEACVCVCCTNKRTKNSTIKKPSDVRPKPALRAPAISTQGRALREKSSITTKKEPIFTRLLSDLRKEIDIDIRIRDPDDVVSHRLCP